MKKIIGILIILITLWACDEEVVKKPEHLIKEKTMISMLVDIHLAEATFNMQGKGDEKLKNTTSADFYYSVLDKYHVQDSVFENSLIYYTSNPKNFEKMYRKVMSRLSETEQEFSGRKEDILDFDKSPK